VRPVAHGIRITCPISPTTIQGELHLCLYPMSQATGSTWALPVNVSQMQRLPSYKRVPLAELTQKPMIYVNKYMDDTAFRYFDPNDTFLGNLGSGTNAFDFGNQWCCIVIAIENPYGSVTNNLDIENSVILKPFKKLVQLKSINLPNLRSLILLLLLPPLVLLLQ